MNLSPHFTRADLEKSDYAQRHNINNSIPDDQIATWKLGLEVVVEPLVKLFPDLMLGSAFRNEDLNRGVGGSKNSQHRGLFYMEHRKPPKYVSCCAFDLEIPLKSGGNIHLLRTVVHSGLPFDEAIWEYGTPTEPAWVHVSYVPNETNRRKVIRFRMEKDSLGQNKLVKESITVEPPEQVKRLAHIVNPQPPLPTTRTIAGGSASI